MSVVIDARPGRRARRGCFVGVFLFGLVMIAPLMAGLVGIWPGVLKFTAPVLCDDDHDEAVIARDTYHTRPGETSTTFTMYCLNDRGEATDEGAFKPIAIVFGVLAAIYVLLAVVVLIVGAGRRNRGGPPEAMPTVVSSSPFGGGPYGQGPPGPFPAGPYQPGPYQPGAQQPGPHPAGFTPPPAPGGPWQQPPG